MIQSIMDPGVDMMMWNAILKIHALVVPSRGIMVLQIEGDTMQKAAQILARLSEVEKIHLRGASLDRVHFIADTAHLSDFPDSTQVDRHVVMAEVQALCLLEFYNNSSKSGFSGSHWQF
jgi:hypothetical protein